VHALFAEWIWRPALGGHLADCEVQAAGFSDLRLPALALGGGGKTADVVRGRRHGRTVEQLFFYTTTSGEPHERILWQVMVHLVNHGTQHRSEAAALLTDFGHSPGDLDLVYFLAEL
jgi:hypothetical protein